MAPCTSTSHEPGHALPGLRLSADPHTGRVAVQRAVPEKGRGRMSGTKHTPGPWIQDEDNPLCIGTPKPWYPRQVYRIVATLEGGKEYTANHNATAEANARLITAAPELLEALRSVEREHELVRLIQDCASRRPRQGFG